MPSFGSNERRGEDFLLLRTGAIHLYWRHTFLDETMSKLRNLGYQVLAVDASQWSSTAAMHADMARTFSFRAHYGNNMDALNDCLRDVALGNEGSQPRSATALVVDHFDAFVRADASAAHTLIDIFADNSRLAMLIGHRNGVPSSIRRSQPETWHGRRHSGYVERKGVVIQGPRALNASEE